MAEYGNIHCISLRCRLCRFLFQPDEKVVASVGGRLSDEFPNGLMHTHEDLDVTLRACAPNCWCEQHDRGRIPSYHPRCLEFTSPPSDTALRATEYSFEPDAREEERRRGWILALLADRMSETHSRLPAEIRLLIAQNLVRECAIAVSQQAWDARCSQDCDVDISLETWAEYTYVDGVRYISHLSNRASQTSTARQVIHAEAPRVTAVYVLEDHLGIRELVFGGTEDYTPSAPLKTGLWWRTVPLTSERVKMRSDGIKLRHVNSTLSTSALLWRLPMAPSQLRSLRLLPFAPSYEYVPKPDTFQMLPLDLNASDVTGYSACCSPSNIIMLHAHRAGESLDFYKDLSVLHPRAVWIHVPMSSGERISEIWVRHGKYYDHMGMLLRTNKARQTDIGMHISPRLFLMNGYKQPAWKQLCALPETPSRLFFHSSSLGIHLLSTKETTHLNAPLLIPQPLSYPITHGILDYFYSSASLEDVVEVTPSHMKLATHSHISGLLFQYANGERARVGEVRLDSLGETLQVQPGNRLHITFHKLRRPVAPHVTSLYLDSNLDNGSREWLSLPWTGVLEWLFNYGHCKVYHQGKESPSVFG